MKVQHTQRGFELIEVANLDGIPMRLIQASSQVGDYDDAWDRPGSSAVLIGSEHLLNREQAAELAAHLNAWARTGSLVVDETSS